MSQLDSAVETLQRCLDQADKDRIGAEDFWKIVEAYDPVMARFQAVFSESHLHQLTEQEFREFLVFKNNRHWKSIHRHGRQICQDMPRLREALGILFDESRPIQERLNELVNKGKANYVPSLGRAILTPLLLIKYPERYGVWNKVAEQGMDRLGIWPKLDPKLPFGERYARVNQVMLGVAERVGVNLWTLDSLWWLAEEFVEEPATIESKAGVVPGSSTQPARFGLERHLHEFLRDNWLHTELAEDWDLYEQDGEEGAGYEFDTGEIGRIDLLAKHKREPRWLVVELKRDRASDRTVGQVLRYVGWVQSNLATERESVEGMIISHRSDKQIEYALKTVPNIGYRTYEVSFKLC